ncbi:MAG: selenocysteine-specific translation elongation factor [Gemmatimonadota bacterium]|nr:selenocysteine-specific translation elongation factor [Gemmatimonadota bacterium]
MILGTAGHIDHGKTALVRALTGVDTDRLPEEKRRGITIALGFAPLELPGVGTVGVVDVPGHEAFVRTMLAGATGIDLALLVIAADEGVMPQTREHLAILTLLGVRGGAVALSKADLVDAELLELQEEEVRAVLAGSPLADAPIIPVSAHTGVGLDALRATLAELARAVPAREADDLWRMPVDRVFSVTGAGTVVTGTAWSGTLERDDALRVLPAGHAARVRSIETHGAATASARPGSRTAIALAGLDRAAVAHQAVLVREGDPWVPSRVLRADLVLLAAAPTIGPRRQLRFHLGTAEAGCRVVAPGGPVAPGATRAVRLLLDRPVVARAGDRFVLRAGSPVGTLGGGVITDPAPPGARARPFAEPHGDAVARLGWILDEAGANGVAVASLPVRVGVRPAQVERLLRDVKGTARVGDRLVRSRVLDVQRAALLAAVARAHAANPLAPGLDRQTARRALGAHEALADEVIRRAERAGLIAIEGAWIRSPGFTAGAGATASAAKDRLLDRLRETATEPPSVAELVAELGDEVPALLKLLEKEKLVVPVALDRWYAREAIVTQLARLREHVTPGTAYSPSELREVLGTTRKFLIPFLEWCDRRGISHRTPTGRRFHEVPGEP